MLNELKKIGNAFLAAIVSPTVRPQEKKLAVFVLTRVLLAAGASSALVALAVGLFK